MKKLLVGMMVAVMGLSMTASALPAVTYDEAGCELTSVLNAEYTGWIMLLNSADVNEIASALEASIDQVDMEFMGMDGENYKLGDGIPDMTQLGLFSSAVCADETLATAYDGNIAAMNLTLGNIQTLLTWASADQVAGQSKLVAVGTQLHELAVALGEASPYYETVEGLSQGAAAFGGILLPGINLSSKTAQIAGGLNAVKEVLAALASTSFNAKGLLDELLGSMLEGLNEPIETLDNKTPSELAEGMRVGFTGLSQLLLAAPPAGLGMTELGTAVADAATYMTGSAEKIAAVGAPSFNVLGVTAIAKVTYNQAFAASGDYNDDGVSNLEMWNLAGGDTNKFIAQASGSDPWWTGNPGLPAVGLVGLVALIGAISAGGATMLRKK